MPDLIAIGECMVEFYADRPLAEAATFTRSFGGDSLNALVAAARLGTTGGYVTRLGDDPFTPFLEASWRQEGIDLSHVRRAPRPNGLYFISLLPGGEREFAYYRTGSAASTLDPTDLDPAYLAAARALHVTGIGQAISPTARATILAACRIARQAGRLVSYDPNYRPRLWPDPNAARAANFELLPYVDLILPSLPDETSIFLGTTDPRAAAEQLWRQGIDLVAFKAGQAGVVVAERAAGTYRTLPAYPTTVVDTTGAGDAFAGGLLHGLLSGLPPLEAARLGAVTAGLKCRGRGAVASLPTAAQVHTALAAWPHE